METAEGTERQEHSPQCGLAQTHLFPESLQEVAMGGTFALGPVTCFGTESQSNEY